MKKSNTLLTGLAVLSIGQLGEINIRTVYELSVKTQYVIKAMRIALIQCPFWSALTPPYNLALLSACLKKENHEVFCFDFNIKLRRYAEFKKKLIPSNKESNSIDWYEQKEVLRFVEDYEFYIGQLIEEVLVCEPQVIGFSIYDTSRWLSEVIASRIKRQNPEIKIIFGGQSCFRKGFAEELLKNPYVDAVCISEGEIALVNFLANLDRNGCEDTVVCPGFVSRKQNSSILAGDRQDFIGDLDRIPFADFSSFDLRFYDEMGLPISTSRGCVNRCLFCEESVAWGKYRKRSAQNIYSEITYQIERFNNVGYFFFNDSLINGDMRMLDELTDLIIAGGSNFSWGGQAAIREEMSFEFLKKMKGAGFSFVSFGMESASPRVLKLMSKNFTPALAEKIIQDAKSLGIYVSVNIIVGFPDEAWEDVVLTLDFLRKNLSFIDEIYLHPFVLMPESLIFRRKEDLGIKILSPDRIRGWLIEEGEGKNNFEERLKKLKFIKESLNSKVNIPFSNLSEL